MDKVRVRPEELISSYSASNVHSLSTLLKYMYIPAIIQLANHVTAERCINKHADTVNVYIKHRNKEKCNISE